MKRILIVTTAVSLLAAPAFAQNWNNNNRHDNNRHDDHRGNSMMMMHRDDHHGRDHRHEWRRGSRLDHNTWNRGQRVDYRAHRLSRPPRGYEWRRVDDNYVLAAVATGVIASILLANN